MTGLIKDVTMVTNFERRQLCHKAPREATAVINVRLQSFQELRIIIRYTVYLTSPFFFGLCFNMLRN